MICSEYSPNAAGTLPLVTVDELGIGAAESDDDFASASRTAEASKPPPRFGIEIASRNSPSRRHQTVSRIRAVGLVTHQCQFKIRHHLKLLPQSILCAPPQCRCARLASTRARVLLNGFKHRSNTYFGLNLFLRFHREMLRRESPVIKDEQIGFASDRSEAIVELSSTRPPASGTPSKEAKAYRQRDMHGSSPQLSPAPTRANRRPDTRAEAFQSRSISGESHRAIEAKASRLTSEIRRVARQRVAQSKVDTPLQDNR